MNARPELQYGDIVRTVLPSATVNLLLASQRLIHLLHGDKRDFFRRAWIACALQQASIVMRIEEDRLPTQPRAAVLALHEAVLQLGEAHGITRRDFVEAFNDHGESGDYGKADSADEAIARCVSLLTVLSARRLENV
jgi:hypothetical protein